MNFERIYSTMLYIGSKQGNKYGVVDTDNCIISYYTVEDIINYSRRLGIGIQGLDLDSGRVIINEDNIRSNMSMIRKLLIENNNLSKFDGIKYDIGDDFFPEDFTLYVCDMDDDNGSDYIFLTYDTDTNRYNFYEGTDTGVLLKDYYSKQLDELGLTNLKFDTYMTFDEMLSYVKSGLKNSFRRKLDKDSLEPLLHCVDQPEGWHFPSGEKTLQRAVELAHKGYFIVVDGEYMCPRELERKLKVDLKTPNTFTPYTKFYSFVKEYIDNKNKVFYCNFGKVRCESLM